MNSDITDKIARIISENILTPVIYMLEHDDALDFICFCDRNITMGDIYETERRIKKETGRCAEIIDIREFGEAERLEVVNRAELIYSEHPLIEKIFAQSMAEDFKIAIEERNSVLERRREQGTCYLQ